MASLSNINGLFDVHSTGAILFSTSHGTSGQILRSNGNAAPTWVAASTVIGGPYLPIAGGVLEGATSTDTGINFTVGGNLFVTGTSTLTGALAGTSAAFTDNVSIGVYASADTGSLLLNGSTANRQSVLKCTNGNLHIDADSTYITYINYYTGSGGITFGNGAGAASGASVSSTGIVYATGGNSGIWNTHTSNTGTVTSVATGNGLTGGTIISTGTLTMSGAYSGSMQFSGAHGSSQVGCQLPAANNGANTGVVNLRMWCSEPGVTWDWAGFGYNVTNDNGNPNGFGRLNTAFGQAYQRYSSSGDMYFYNTNTAGARVTTLTLNSNGQATFGYTVTAPTFVGALTGNATTATTLQTARTIAGVSFNGSANISLNNNAITNGAGYITSYTETDTLATVTARGASTGTSSTFGSTGVNTKLRVVDTTYYTSPTYSWTNSAIQTTSMEIIDATTDNANVCATLVMHNYGDGGVKFRMGNTGDKTLYLSSGQSAGAGNPTDDNSGTYFDEMKINNAVVYHTGNLPSGSGVTSVATGSGLTGGTITTTGTLSVDSTVIRTTGNQSITGNTTFYPSSTGTGYSTAAIELMSSSSGASGTPPRIGFHWGGVVASVITIEANGTIAVRNNPGNAYEQFKASTITATSSFQGNLTGNVTGSAGTLTHNANRGDSASYPVVWMAGSPSPAYSCAAVTITSSAGRVHATSFQGDIFYDTNSAYYGDFASTSNLNALTLVGTLSGQNAYFNQDLAVGFNSGAIGGKINIQINSANGIGIKNNLNGKSGAQGLLQYTSASYASGGYNMIFQAAPPSGSDTNMLLCYLNGNIVNRFNSYGQYSDRKLKENIVDTTPKLEDVKKIRIRNFNFKDDPYKQIGVIAQEFEEVFPGLVEDKEVPDQDETVKTVKYSVLVPILVKAIQELETRVKELENK